MSELRQCSLRHFSIQEVITFTTPTSKIVVMISNYCRFCFLQAYTSFSHYRD